LRNLTGDKDQQNLLDAFASDLAADLTRRGRGFSLRSLANFAEGPESDVKYFVAGSAQRGSPGMLRINVRITDASTFEYLWARRFEFDADETVPMRAKIIRRISRELHILLLQQKVGRVVCELGAGHGSTSVFPVRRPRSRESCGQTSRLRHSDGTWPRWPTTHATWRRSLVCPGLVKSW
jgi:TolB-like protein